MGRAITALVEALRFCAGDPVAPGGQDPAPQHPGNKAEQAALYAATRLAYNWARRQSGAIGEPPDGIFTEDTGEGEQARGWAGWQELGA